MTLRQSAESNAARGIRCHAGKDRAGDGWRAAGFTSANPSATDLIGCGVLGLLHLMLLLEKRPTIAAELCGDAAAAAETPHQQQLAASPMLLSVHVTLWTVHALKMGLISRAAQRLKSTFTAAGTSCTGWCNKRLSSSGAKVHH